MLLLWHDNLQYLKDLVAKTDGGCHAWADSGPGSARSWCQKGRAAFACQMASSGLRNGSIEWEPCKHMVH